MSSDMQGLIYFFHCHKLKNKYQIMYLARQEYAKKKSNLESFSLFPWCIFETVALRATNREQWGKVLEARHGKAETPDLRWRSRSFRSSMK